MAAKKIGKKTLKSKKKNTTGKLVKPAKAKSAQSTRSITSKLKKTYKTTKSKPKVIAKATGKVKQKAKSKAKMSSKVVIKSSKIKTKDSNKLTKKNKDFSSQNIPIIKKKISQEHFNEDLDFNLEKNGFYEYEDHEDHEKQNIFESFDNQDLYEPSKFQPYHIDVTEEYMNEQQLEHFANILNNWKQELMEEVDHTISEMKEADVLADPNDRATQEETFNLELRTRDRERRLIKKIEAALNKIDEQQYGYCESCGVEIGIRRLEARPTATLCIECKTLAEIKEKRS